MQGTPYVYQGEELGMTNCPFGPIENYRDLETVNAYYELTEAGLREPEELLAAMAQKSRDNARTPMQWDSSPNAGFTSGTPWIMVNPNYTSINAAAQEKDPDSVLNFYRRLIRLRRESEWKDIIAEGSFLLLSPEDEEVFAYLRPYQDATLLTVCNFSPAPRTYLLPPEVPAGRVKTVLAAPAAPKFGKTLALAPWQAAVWVILQ